MPSVLAHNRDEDRSLPQLFRRASQSLRDINIVFPDAAAPECRFPRIRARRDAPAGFFGTFASPGRKTREGAIDRARTPSYTRRLEPVAQPVEHLTFNQGVVGSSPTGLAKLTNYEQCLCAATRG